MKYILPLFLCLIISVNSKAQSEDDLLDKADSCNRWGMYDCALNFLQQLLNKYPDNVQALDMRAVIYNRLENYAAALKDEEQLMKLRPQQSHYFRDAAWHSLLVKKFEQGLKYGLEALRISSSQHKNSLVVANAYALLEDEENLTYYYKMAAEYASNELAVMDAVAEVRLLAEKKLFPFKTKPVEDIFYYYWDRLGNNSSTSLLDDIQVSLRFRAGEYDDELMLEKEKFTTEESKQEYSRYYVLRDFYWQLGLYNMNKRNRQKAMDLYFPKALYTSSALQDTVMMVKQCYTLAGYSTKEELRGAISLLLQAIDYSNRCRKVSQEMRVSLRVRLSENYDKQKKFDSSLYWARSAYNTALANADSTRKMVAAGRLCISFVNRRQFDSALYYHEISRNYSNRSLLADQVTMDYNLCSILYAADKNELALQKSKEYAAYYSKEGRYKQANISDFFYLVGKILFDEKKNDEAEKWLRQSITVYKESLRGKGDVPFEEVPGNKQLYTYKLLKAIAMQSKKPDAEKLFSLSEDSKANSFYTSFTGNSFAEKTITLPEVRKALSSDEILLTYSIDENASSCYAIAITKETARSVTLPLASIESFFTDNGLGKWLPLINQVADWFIAQRSTDSLDIIRRKKALKPIFMLAACISWYKGSFEKSKSTRSTITQAIKKDTSSYEEFRLKGGKLLYHFLFSQFEDLLQEKRTIFLMQDQAIATLPFEALKNNEGKYLAEQYNIIYVPSFTVAELMKKRSKPTGTNKVLAVGNADYRNFHPKETGRAYDLAAMGLTNWSDLPGTEQELNSIKQNIPDVTTVQQAQLSETWMKLTSLDGELSKYNFIHFAVHGLYSVNDPEDNSLVLTDNENEDGFFQFSEIRQLNIKSKLVTLSACETAEGIPSADIAPNLVSAFIMAGADGVIATSWKVDDAATALFMKQFYSLIFSQKLTITEALAKTRRSFINGEYGETYKAPYYWAPFKYTGIQQ